MLDIVETILSPVKLIRSKRHVDARGFFSETYSWRDFAAAGFARRFVQDNHSLSCDRGVVRGLHFQIPPYAQAKLLRVLRGAIFDVVVDIRSSSPTYGRHFGTTLSAAAWNQIYVPEGFAHGFCTLEPDTEVFYKVTRYYAAAYDRGLSWNDPALGIDWPVGPTQAILSERDQRHPRLADLPDYFQHEAQRPERARKPATRH
jgi:dTDP-4-dehydrorhamnose 3,5-epimerase